MGISECQGVLCSVFNVQPLRVVVKFNSNGRKHEKKEFKVTNVSCEKQRIDIDSSSSKHFKITPNLTGRTLIPGKTVYFLAVLDVKTLEQKVYNDIVRISCPLKCVVNVLLTAVPKVRPFSYIPTKVDFGRVPLGQKRTRLVHLRSIKTDMPFVLMIGNSSQDLSITPARGIVKSGTRPLEVTIAYRPTAHVTLNVQVSLHLPTVLLEPFIFNVSAFTTPGSFRKEPRNESTSNKLNERQIERTFTHPTWLLKPLKCVIPKKTTPIWSQHSSNKILFSHMKDKRSPYELLGPLGKYLDEESSKAISLENSFLDEVALSHRENYLAHSHTRDKLRSIDWSLIDRDCLWKEYLKRYDISIEVKRKEASFIRQRTIRRADVEIQTLSFTNKLPNVWFPRYVNMAKFIEAGRRIIHKNRLIKVLKKFKQLNVEDIAKYENPPVDPF